MNVAFLPEEKYADLPQAVGNVHAAFSDAPDEKGVAALQEEAENAEQKRRVIEKVRQFLLTVTYTAIGIYLILLVTTNSLWMNMGLLFVLLVPHVINYLYGTLSYSHIKRVHDVVMDLLKSPKETRLMLPLVDSLNASQGLAPKRHSLISSALTDCLWNQATPDAALLLDETRRATLRKWLMHPYSLVPLGKSKVHIRGYFDELNTDLAVAIMKTLAGLGDKKSVNVLQKIIRAEVNAPYEAVVGDAAREYLPILIQKITENDELQRQLRKRASEPIHDPQKMVEEFVDTLSPETAKVALVEFLRNEEHGKVTCAGIAVAVGLLACLLPYLGMHDFILLFFVIVIFLLPSVCALLVVANSKWSDEARIIAHELAKRSETDTRLLAILLQAARFTKTAKQSDALKKAFARLLPLLQPGDAARVPPAQRPYLRSWLCVPRFKKQRAAAAGVGSQTLAVAALDALAALGDTKALFKAERLARRTRRGTYRETEMHEAALRCVEALRARKQNSGT